MKSVRTVFFSPTGTTRRVLEGIIQGLDVETVEYIDLTSAQMRTARQVDGCLTLIGTPVYAGRVPIQVAEALSMIMAAGAPAVLVAVYGNRAYEDALYELNGITEKAGFRPFAAAAFIGEHSFSTRTTPIAAGRPDKEDLEKALSFGKLVRAILERAASPETIGILSVPGNAAFRDRHSMSVCPESADDLCVRCGKCEGVCPQQAITITENTVVTDKDRCIRICCACMKACPTGARRITDPTVLQFIGKVAGLCRDRKEPEFFFPAG